MSTNQDFNRIGEEIKDAVEDALSSMDFTKLNDTIANTVNEVRKQIQDALAGKTDRFAKQDYFRDEKVKTPREVLANENKPQVVAWRPVGRVSNVLYTVFGGIGVGVMGILALWQAIPALMTMTFPVPLRFTLFFLLIFLGMIWKGSAQRGRLERLPKYLKACGERTYCDTKELAEYVGKKVSFVRRDVEKMVMSGMLPHAHLDEKNACLMLDDDTWMQYLRMRRDHAARKNDLKSRTPRMKAFAAWEKEREGLVTPEKPEPPTDQQMRKLNEMIAQGQEYIAKLRELNDEIPGEEVSDKLYRMEHVLTVIFDALKTRPSKQFQMQKFMDYYLPTTLKLVVSYAEFDKVPIQGENILDAKQEILKTLDTINKAFEKLLNDLYQEDTLDAATDAQVLQIMLAQEGLAEDEAFTNAGSQDKERNEEEIR